MDPDNVTDSLELGELVMIRREEGHTDTAALIGAIYVTRLVVHA